MLWAWTAVTAPPPGYQGEVPFGVGVVELPEGLRVITRLTEGDPGALASGQPMELRIVPLHRDGGRQRRGHLRLRAGGPVVSVVTVNVAGVGLHPFGRFDGVSTTDMGVVAVRAALHEAGVGKGGFQAAFCGTAYGGVATGHKVLSRLGMTGMPIVDVEAGCASGGAALMLAAGAIRAGTVRHGARVRDREDATGDHPFLLLRALAGGGGPGRHAGVLRAARPAPVP